MSGTYEDSTTINASPQEVFGYVSDIAHLPDYLPPIKQAEARALSKGTETDPGVQGAYGVHLVGEMKGQQFDNEGWFLADDSQRTLRWGAQTEQTYSGQLEVSENESGSLLSVSLDFGPGSPDDELQEQAGDRDPVHEALAATLQSVKQQVEGTGGKVLPPESPGDLPLPDHS